MKLHPALLTIVLLLGAAVSSQAPAALTARQPSAERQPEKTPAAATPQQPPASQPEKKEQPASKPPADPSVDDVIKDMQTPAPARTTVSPQAKPAAVQARPAASSRPRGAEPGKTKLVREGTFIVSRRGRLVRSATGDWLFAFDSDTDQKPGNDPSMTLMPCEKLMAMERIAERHGEDVTYSLTGQVFVYHGRNFLLPTNYVVNRPNEDVKPLQ